MTRVPGASELALIIQRRLVGVRKDTSGDGARAVGDPAGKRAAKRQDGSQGGRGPGASVIPEAALERIRHVIADGPHGRRQAFRIFLESVLLVELGGELVNDPSFDALVTRVQSLMEEDPQLRDLVESAGQALITRAAQLRG